MKFKKTKINTKGYHENMKLDAWQLGDWAYHPQRVGLGLSSRFSITHVPTGLKIPDSFLKKEARELTKLLAENVTEWHPSEKKLDDCIRRDRWPKKFRTECQKAINNFRKGGN